MSAPCCLYFLKSSFLSPFLLCVLPFFLAQNRAHPDALFRSIAFPICLQILQILFWSVFQVYAFFPYNRNAAAPALLSDSWIPATASERLIWHPVPSTLVLRLSSDHVFSKDSLSASREPGTAVGSGAVKQATVLPSAAYIPGVGADSELSK